MDMRKYFENLSDECDSMMYRVRNLIKDQHWPTDGEWKESVLRSMIRRTIGADITVGRGFVVLPGAASVQIDVLLYDSSHPVLHRDGDLVFVTPSACRGIVEVKSTLDQTEFTAAIEKLADNAEFIRTNGGKGLDFVGLFAYECQFKNEGPRETALRRIASTAAGNKDRVINHVTLGSSMFVRFWADVEPDNIEADHWSLYSLPSMSPGYFIHNLVLALCGTPEVAADSSWFPKEGKATSREAWVPLS